jgi:hypothetical protein
MWEEYSSAGGDSSDGDASRSSAGSGEQYETLDVYIGHAEAQGVVPAVYGGAASAHDAEGLLTLDEYLSDGEVCPGGEHGDLSDGEVVTAAQADVSFVSSRSAHLQQLRNQA